MAEVTLALTLEQDTYDGEVLEARFEFPASPSNTSCVVQFLRGFKKASGKQGVFSQERIVQAIPDFEGTTRQSVDEHEQRFRECGKDLQRALTRKRKVDEKVVEAVRQKLLECPLCQMTELVNVVNQRLQRRDLSAANITATLELISVAEVRPVLRRQLEGGTVHYKESYLLNTMMKKMNLETGEFAGLSVSDQQACRFRVVGRTELVESICAGEPGLDRPYAAAVLAGVPLSVLGQ